MAQPEPWWLQIPNWIHSGREGGHYLLIARRGSGGHGIAFVCQREDGYLFIAKWLRPGDQAVPKRHQKLLKEAPPEQQAMWSEASVMATYGRLRDELHENLVQVVDWFADRGLYWLILEYCDASLDQLIYMDDVWSGERYFLKLADGLLVGLEVLHTAGAVHGDVALENTFVSNPDARVDPEHWTFKLGDFGRVARWDDGDGHEDPQLIADDIAGAARVLVIAWYGYDWAFAGKTDEETVQGMPEHYRQPLLSALRKELAFDGAAVRLLLALQGVKPLDPLGGG